MSAPDRRAMDGRAKVGSPTLGASRPWITAGCATAQWNAQPQAGAAADAGDGDRGAGSRPGTSKAAPGHKIYPYLLRGLKIVEPNHVWAADVSVPQQAA